jgi:hypothetical protein
MCVVKVAANKIVNHLNIYWNFFPYYGVLFKVV